MNEIQELIYKKDELESKINGLLAEFAAKYPECKMDIEVTTVRLLSHQEFLTPTISIKETL